MVRLTISVDPLTAVVFLFVSTIVAFLAGQIAYTCTDGWKVERKNLIADSLRYSWIAAVAVQLFMFSFMAVMFRMAYVLALELSALWIGLRCGPRVDSFFSRQLANRKIRKRNPN